MHTSKWAHGHYQFSVNNVHAWTIQIRLENYQFSINTVRAFTSIFFPLQLETVGSQAALDLMGMLLLD